MLYIDAISTFRGPSFGSGIGTIAYRPSFIAVISPDLASSSASIAIPANVNATRRSTKSGLPERRTLPGPRRTVLSCAAAARAVRLVLDHADVPGQGGVQVLPPAGGLDQFVAAAAGDAIANPSANVAPAARPNGRARSNL